MTDSTAHEIIIVKRRSGGEHDAHHGGVWKIAFADFMTAMMAFFLVLWIVNSTSKETRVSVARYFNPVKLAENTPARRGLDDAQASAPENTEPGPKEEPARALTKGRELPANKLETLPEGQQAQSHDTAPPNQPAAIDTAVSPASARSDESLLANPDKALADIVKRDVDPLRPPDIGDAARADNPAIRVDEFRDPFATAAPRLARRATASAPSTPTIEAAAAASQSTTSQSGAAQPRTAAKAARGGATENPAKSEAAAPGPAPANDAAQTPPGAGQPAAEAVAQSNLAEQTKKISASIFEALRADIGETALPQIDVKLSDEGILISLTDHLGFEMFALGSAEPQARTIRVIERIARVLKDQKGLIVVRGHTDARPYRTGTGDNWRLSSSRAQMAYHMLRRGGLDDARFDRIEGHAARHPRDARNPQAAENRRIEILLRREKP